METLHGSLVQQPVERVIAKPTAFAPFELCQNLGLGRREHTVETAEHRHRQHDPLVLRWPIGATQQIGNLPNEIC